MIQFRAMSSTPARDDVSSEEVNNTPTRKLKISFVSAARRLSACEASQALRISSPRSEERRSSVSFGCTYEALQDPSSPLRRIGESNTPTRHPSSERKGSALSERRGKEGLLIHETQSGSPNGPGPDEKQQERRTRRPKINIDSLIVVMNVAHSALKLVPQAEDRKKSDAKKALSADHVITVATEGLESWLSSLRKVAELHRKAEITCDDECVPVNAQTGTCVETQTVEDEFTLPAALHTPSKRSLAAQMAKDGAKFSSSETETEPATPIGTLLSRSATPESLGFLEANSFTFSLASDTSAPPSPMPSAMSARDAASPAFADRMQRILRALQKVRFLPFPQHFRHFTS